MKADTLPKPIVKPIDATTIDETDEATAQPRMAAMAARSRREGSSHRSLDRVIVLVVLEHEGE